MLKHGKVPALSALENSPARALSNWASRPSARQARGGADGIPLISAAFFTTSHDEQLQADGGPGAAADLTRTRECGALLSEKESATNMMI